MQVNNITISQNYNSIKRRPFSEKKANYPFIQNTERMNLTSLPPIAYFHPSFCQAIRFPNAKATVYGAGGLLFNLERFGLRDLFGGKLFDKINVSVFDPSIERLNQFSLRNTFNVLQNANCTEGSSLWLLSPSKYHPRQVAEAVASSGDKDIKGVFIEKAMCINKEQLQELETTTNASQIPLYYGDHYYFANIGGLRLMGVDMPFKNKVVISSDKTPGKRFTQCMQNAQAYFLPEDIKRIKSKMNETNVSALVSRPWYYQPNSGGGVILDLQLHVFDILNMMGLKLTDVAEARGLRYPYSQGTIANMCSKDPLKHTEFFTSLKPGGVEDAAFVKGKINGNIPTELESIRYAPNNDKYIIIEGKNGETIKLHVTGGERKVQLLSKDGQVEAEAFVDGKPYDLMIEDAQSYFSGEKSNKDTGFLSALFDAQKSALEQVFRIKDKMGI